MKRKITRLEMKDANFRNSLRVRHRTGKLSEKQIKKVESSLPGWQWEPLSFQPYFDLADKFIKERKTIPYPEWLRNNGYRKLAEKIKLFPDQFSKYPQERGNNHLSDEECVFICEELAKLNGGTYYPGLLQKMGYAQVYERVKTKPQLFVHIEKTAKKKSLADHVKDAEEIANNNGGKMPIQSVLKKQGKGSLIAIMAKKPSAFRHIPKDPAGRINRKEAKNKIDLLIKEHGGLRSNGWYRKNGMGGLYSWISRYPEDYVNVKRLDAHTPIKERVLMAKELVKQFGFLPSYRWMNANGHRGLCASISQYPEHYKHLPRKGKTK